MRDTACHYPAPYWLAKEGDRIKSLLLFFDEVAILLPDYMRGRHLDADPSLAGPLEEQGLLRVLEPKEWIDAEVAETLAKIMVELLAGGVFDGLREARYFAELSQSRIGYRADAELAGFLVDVVRQPSHSTARRHAECSGVLREISPPRRPGRRVAIVLTGGRTRVSEIVQQLRGFTV